MREKIIKNGKSLVKIRKTVKINIKMMIETRRKLGRRTTGNYRKFSKVRPRFLYSLSFVIAIIVPKDPFFSEVCVSFS